MVIFESHEQTLDSYLINKYRNRISLIIMQLLRVARLDCGMDFESFRQHRHCKTNIYTKTFHKATMDNYQDLFIG